MLCCSNHKVSSRASLHHALSVTMEPQHSTEGSVYLRFKRHQKLLQDALVFKLHQLKAKDQEGQLIVRHGTKSN